MPFAQRGYGAASLLGHVTGPTSCRLHTPRDVPAYVQTDALDRCGRLARDVILAWLASPQQPPVSEGEPP